MIFNKTLTNPPNALAIATLAKTATNGTTIIPDPRSWQIVKKDIVSFLYSKLNGGKENVGTPGSTLPVNR